MSDKKSDTPIPTPDEVIERRRVKLAAEIEALRASCVEELDDKFDDQEHPIVEIAVAGCKRLVVDTVQREFNNKGWMVELSADKQSLKFSRRKEIVSSSL